MKSIKNLSSKRLAFPRLSRTAAVLGGGLLLALGGSLQAQTTYTYIGASGGSLDLTTNWNPNVVPGSTTTTSDTAFFTGGTTLLTVNPAASSTFGGATGTLGALVSVDGSQTGGVTFGNGGTIRLAGVTVASGAGPVTFSGTSGYNISGVNAPTTNTFTNNSGSTLTFSGNLQAGGSSASSVRTLDFTGTGGINVSGAVGTTGTFIAVQKDGAGTLTLGGANGYVGTTTLNTGITKIANATALGTTAGGTTVASGATLQILGSITVGAEALTISGGGATGGAGALENNGGTNNYGGAVTLAANSTIASDNGTTLNLTSSTAIAGGGFTLTLAGSGTGSITGGVATGALTKTGTGTWTLGGTSTYAGATTVNGGGALLVTGSTGAGAVGVTGTGTTLGGTGTVGGVVTVGSGAILQGGAGTATGTLTLTATPVLNAGSVIGLTLGTGNTHSTLALSTTGFNGFQASQSFTLGGLQAGTYDNIITGVAPGITTTGWTVTNGSGYTFSFTDDGANIDLVVTAAAVPEPSTWAAGVFCLGLMALALRRRLAERA